MRRFRSFAAGLTASLLLSGCGSVYLHDEGLKTTTGKAHEALAGVAPLKPFDDQLANLEEFAKREDQGVADYWTAVRDKHFDGLLLPDAIDRTKRINDASKLRLAALIGGPPYPDVRALLEARNENMEEKAAADRTVAGNLKEYLRLRGKQDSEAVPGKDVPASPVERSELSCEKLVRTPRSEIDRLDSGTTAQQSLVTLIKSCELSEQRRLEALDLAADYKSLPGTLASLVKQVEEARGATETTDRELSNRAAQIKEKIERAKIFRDQTSALAQLTAMRNEIRGLLADADEATRAAGWEEAHTIVGDLLRTEVCEAPKEAVDEKTKKDAKCGEIVPDSTSGKARASWAFLKALGQLQDADAEDRTGANWLLAARAIITAEKADSVLRLAEAKARAAMLQQRLDASLIEVAGLIDATGWSESRGLGNLPHKTDCWASLKEDRRQANTHCAFASYVDAWNRGRVPAEVLAFRDVQIEREFAVRRARAATEKQYALASAGTSALKDYFEGGVMPATVAQTVLDLATIGILRAED